MRALLFEIEKYNSRELYDMNENELYELARRGQGSKAMYLDAFQEAINNKAIDLQNFLVYFIH